MLSLVPRSVGRCCRVFVECHLQHRTVAPPSVTISRNVHDAMKDGAESKKSSSARPKKRGPHLGFMEGTRMSKKTTSHPLSAAFVRDTDQQMLDCDIVDNQWSIDNQHSTDNRYSVDSQLSKDNRHSVDNPNDVNIQNSVEPDENPGKKEARPLSYYSNLGMRQRKVDQLIRRSREHEGVGASTDVKRMRGFIDILGEHDFVEEEVAELIMKKPRIFDMSTKELKRRIDALIRHGYLEASFKVVIMKDPNLLVYDEKKASIAARLKNLLELDLSPKLDRDTAFYLVQKCPKLLSVTDVSVLNSRIYNLISYGLGENQMHKLVLNHPSVLLQKESTLNPKIDYITNLLGAPSGLIVKCPRALTQSLRRIKERHLYLVKENMFKTGSGRRLTENQLRALVLTSDQVFVSHITKTTMEDFREFQRQITGDEDQDSQESKKVEDSDSDNGPEYGEVRARDDSYDADEGAEEPYCDEDHLEDDDVYPDKRKYLTSFGSTSRQREISDEEWYSMPFNEIQSPETRNVNRIGSLSNKSRSKSFHRNRR